METIQVGIESLVRASIDDPWKMTFLTPVNNIRMTATLGDGGVEVGPRLREVLASIEKNQMYPRTFMGRELDLLGMATRDSFVVKLLSNVPAYIEISFKPYRQFLNPSAPKLKGTHTEMNWTLEELLKDVEMEEAPWFATQAILNDGGGGSTFTPKFDDTIHDTGYLLTGKVTKIKDGDTIIFEIDRVGNMIDTDLDLAKGKSVDIRFAGINTPETLDHGEAEGNERNKEYIKAHNVTQEQAFAIGKEALDKVQSIISSDTQIIINVDTTASGFPKVDKYGRYVGAVYSVKEKDVNKIFESGFTGDNVSKVLLGTMSTTKSDAPLAIPYLDFIDGEYSRLSPGDWLYDVGIRVRDKERIGDKIKREEKKKKDTDAPDIEAGTTVDVRPIERRSNQIDFIEPYDDRAEELFPDGVDDRVRIGDVMLVIPPMAIEVNRVTNTQKIKTLRSKSSMIIKGGSSVTTLSLQLYFHDLESINGRRVRMHPDVDRYYYMDGLRPLIAQFKKAPFVPIDNQFINETLGVDSVALVNLHVQTVPGFPHSLSATLTLAKFEHEPFMPQLTRLGQGINYPMFRWYYQEPMRDDIDEKEKSEYRTWLSPIPADGLSNDFTFQMVSEEDLISRKDMMRELRFLTNPILAEERFNDPSTGYGSGGDGTDNYTLLGKLYKDGLAAQRVIDMYNRYQKAKKEGLVSDFRIEEGPNKGWLIDAQLISHKNDGKGGEAFDMIYGEDKKDADLAGVSHFAPFESMAHKNNYTLYVKRQFTPDESRGGDIVLRLYSDNNIDLFDKEYVQDKKGDLTTLYMPGTLISQLSIIVRRGKDAEDAYLKGIQEWNDTKAAVEATEGKLTLEDYNIGGFFLPTAMNVTYENQFSSAQLQGWIARRTNSWADKTRIFKSTLKRTTKP